MDLLGKHQVIILAGETGSGKTTLACAILGLLPTNAEISAGNLLVAGQDISHATERTKQRLRGRTIGLVPQDPMVSLNPTERIGKQIGEALILARGHRYPALDADIVALLEQVGLDKPLLRARQYPHELSGGMRQRVLIAIALAGNPRLIIADEPTSALDVTVQRRILDHLQALVRDRGISLLIITHDLGVAADRADNVLVMQNGVLVEQGSPNKILIAPTHNYTRSLIAAAPAFHIRDAHIRGAHIRDTHIQSASPSLASNHAPPTTNALAANTTRTNTQEEPLLVLDRVNKRYPLPIMSDGEKSFQAVKDVSLSVSPGQTLAIVGESGSGKSTLLRLALGLEVPDTGKVTIKGTDVTHFGWRQFRPLRRHLQLVQQNPFASLDPRFSVFDSIVEPLVSFGLAKGKALEQAALRLMDNVHLPHSFLDRLPRELSGGQRQRVAIARALALQPEVLLLDEPVSALDVSVQAQILDLLKELQQELGVAYVLVSHDLAVVANVAHNLLVLRQGQVVEQGLASDIFNNPQSDYTRQLLDSIPGRNVTIATNTHVHRLHIA